MPQDNATYRSFASLRMTNDAIPVILSAAKDLYESSRDYILQIPQLSVKNPKKPSPLGKVPNEVRRMRSHTYCHPVYVLDLIRLVAVLRSTFPRGEGFN